MELRWERKIEEDLVMTLGMLYWILLIVAIVFGVWQSWPRGENATFSAAPLLYWVLFFIVGVALFGWPIK